tara:strand:- start:398 stop:1585 length:1188 start_codon:yes stop_codon:yes gene_type:complete
MSKSANDTLFGITLTELVIILFFIMLLLAMANIEELTERIPENEDDIVPASTVIDLLIPDGEINSDLIPLELIKEEIAKLQEDKEELEEIKQLAEGEGDGDCKEGGNWIQPKCNDFCWEIDEEVNERKFDYLVDIGVCNTSIIVQRSEWLEKDELDFLLVDGAFELVDSQAISRDQLYQFLDIIKEPGYIKEPKQCFHMARLIDLQGVSGDLWNKNGREIRERLGTTDYTSSIAGHKRLKDRFPADICELPAPKKIIQEEKKQVTPVKREPVSQTYSQSEGSLKSEPVISSSINRIKPQMNPGSFNDEFFGIRQCKNTRSDELQLTFIIDLDATGRPLEVRYKGEASSLSSGNRKIESIAKRALLKTKFTPESIEGVNLSSQFEQPLKFRKNICL